MTTNTISRWSTGFVLSLLVGLTGVLFSAMPARAQGGDVCADIQDVSDDALDFYLDELDDEWGVDLANSTLCEDLTKNFIKACQKAVGDAVKCVQNQIKSLTKQNETACKELGSSCDSFKNQSKTLGEIAKSDGEFESNRCEDTVALEFFQICNFGEP